MKIFSWIIKYVIAPFGTLIGLVYGFDQYVVGRANTVVEPTKTAFSAHITHGETIRANIQSSLDRLELESRMMRSMQNDQMKILVDIKRAQ